MGMDPERVMRIRVWIRGKTGVATHAIDPFHPMHGEKDGSILVKSVCGQKVKNPKLMHFNDTKNRCKRCVWALEG